MGENRQEELVQYRFLRREQELYHPTYDEELAFYEMIQSGNLAKLEKKDNWEQIESPERGELSKNHVQSVKYHIVVCITMITRFCIEGGMYERDAYALSDYYINQMDQKKTISELISIQKEMAYAFTKAMYRLRNVKNHSVHCQKALDYMDDHLHETIQIKDIANWIGINHTYLEKLFKQEMGITIGKYIKQQKIKEAKNLLVYTDSGCSEIAQYLAFASGSHFAKDFKRETGMTPIQYRNRYYRKHWEEN